MRKLFIIISAVCALLIAVSSSYAEDGAITDCTKDHKVRQAHWNSFAQCNQIHGVMVCGPQVMSVPTSIGSTAAVLLEHVCQEEPIPPTPACKKTLQIYPGYYSDCTQAECNGGWLPTEGDRNVACGDIKGWTLQTRQPGMQFTKVANYNACVAWWQHKAATEHQVIYRTFIENSCKDYNPPPHHTK